MIETPSCAQLAFGAIPDIYTFLQSDRAHLVFGLVTAMRAVTYFGSRSPYHETVELAATLIAALLVGLVLAVAHSEVPALFKQVVFCQPAAGKEKIALRTISNASEYR